MRIYENRHKRKNKLKQKKRLDINKLKACRWCPLIGIIF